MKEAIEMLKGYKTYIFLGLYIIVVLTTGQVPIEGTGLVFDLDPAAIQEALLASVGIALKAWANRTFGAKDGLEVEVK
jgi:hypothetical protein